MTNIDYKNDFFGARLLIDKNKCSNKYERVYSKSNENVKGILDNFDIEGKEVLTVLGSGDQALNFLNRKAKSVDTFDVNKLTLYYYYLRIWSIRYFDCFYPEIPLCDVLKKVVPKREDEKNAYNFWINYYNIYGNEINFLQNDSTPSGAIIDSLKNLNKRLKKETVTFYNIDIASENIKLNKKYDIIYTSNIARWLLGTLNLVPISNYRENLNRLLKDDGKIICSNILRIINEDHIEVEQMSKRFNFHQLGRTEERGWAKVPGYYYTKK